MPPHIRMCGGIHTYVSFHACVCVIDYGNSCTNSASILFSISSGRAGKKSISVLFSTLSTVTIYFFSGLCPALLGKINPMAFLFFFFLIIYQYDFIESMGDCHFIVANSFGAFSIIYRSAGNIHGSIFFCPLA